mgnify:FL=1
MSGHLGSVKTHADNLPLSYATMFSPESLALAGETYSTSESARKACEFLLSKQQADGGWGESFKVSLLPASFDGHLPQSFSLAKIAFTFRTKRRKSSIRLSLSSVFWQQSVLITKLFGVAVV